ncbi:MAG: HEAT repeat domain-containing protein [Proteobacteria bacterium]|nr:HEAT repeat domain-containing protein [Pseudomonadota bacterium]
MSDIDLARRVTAAYADGLDGLTEADCRDLVEEGGVSESQCGVLMDELNRDYAGYDLSSRFSEAGLSDAFIGELLGENGERAFYRRARWLADNYSKCPLNDPAECKEWKPSVIHNLGSIHLIFSENPVRPLIRKALSDKSSPEVRRAALYAADYLHGVCDIPAFASFLSDGDSWIRDLAVQRIGENLSMGCGDSSLAYKRLIAVLQNEEEIGVRASALAALAHMGAHAWRAVPYLLKLVRTTENGDARFFGDLSHALMSIACGRAMPALIAGMKDESAAVRSAALDAVACIEVKREKNEFESAVLFARIGRGREKTYAVPDIERAVAPAVPVLIGLLDEGDVQTRERAIEALGRIGKTSAPAVQKISYYFKNDDPWVRQTAAVALARIGTDESFLALAESMHEWGLDFGVWLLSTSGVENLGEETANKAAVLFAGMLDSEERDRRLLAALALVKLKAEERKALSLLIKALEEERSEWELMALKSFFLKEVGEIGAGAAEAVPLLVRIWKKGDMYTSSMRSTTLNQASGYVQPARWVE